MFDMTAGINGVSTKHKVLQNTYRLLAMTLVFSAITAFFGMRHPLGGLGQIVLFLVAIGTLFATRAYRNSGAGVLLVFAFTGIMGYTLGPTLNHYLHLKHGSETVAISMLTTSVVFLALSGYVQATQKDFNYLGGFLFVGIIGLIVIGLVGMFFPIGGLSLAMAYFSVLLFSGFILYDTSKILTGRETNYVMATIDLYLDILNMFTSMLRIISSLRG